ncbi:unnamed protein product [Mytilus coruscus]|uniref:protein-tyrosine-phosphatase n=1 Tax=Mytilus coruscus TaxID=42192 RepID=A0A6J8DU15_MYTCO|nr:unnamed protein product [Mytilus coruscus]
MLRFLRSKDRELNKENYPSLNFPEIYLLDSGYKAFFNEQPDLCDPVSYRPMLHSDHSEDLRRFRVKSKSWTAASISTLRFDSTPVKANDLMSVMAPNINRNQFPGDDEDSGLGMDDHITCKPSLKKSAKRQRLEDDCSRCSKRPKVCTDIKAVVTKLEENDDFIADGSRFHTLPTVTGKHSDLKSITSQTLADVVK